MSGDFSGVVAAAAAYQLGAQRGGTATRTLEDDTDAVHGGGGEGAAGGDPMDDDALLALAGGGKKRKSRRGTSGPSRVEPRPAERLSELVLPRTGAVTPLDITKLSNPVIVIHAPRSAGATTLIGTILAGLPGLHAAVVLTDRASVTGGYMHGILPPQVVFQRRKPAAVLETLINMQRHHLENFAPETLPNLAFVMDDVLYSGASCLKDVDFKRNVNIAADFKITVIISTSNVTLLPNDLATFATHVFATKCVDVAREPTALKKAFIMFEGKETLRDALELCRPYEFLVGVLRRSTGGPVQSYLVPNVVPVFAMATSLVEKLSLALQDTVCGK